ncbi:MAG: hypothetical protein CO162_07785, partial [bacterium (Candidatus Ratteibacteria) CG_4_9_14_3_um_filter_41_21]
ENYMSFNLFRIGFIILSAVGGYFLASKNSISGALVGFGGSVIIVGMEMLLQKISVKRLLLAALGLISGLVTAILLSNFILLIPVEKMVELYIRFGLYFAFCYLGVMIAVRQAKEVGFLFPYLSEKKQEGKGILIIDSSVIIDGRLYDICKIGFLPYTLIVPNFIIQELQTIADSSNDLKRQKGRRGLEMLNKMRKDSSLNVRVHEIGFPELIETDSKLVKLALAMNGKILTNDYNLAKVAEVQNVEVLNLNNLATLLKPKLLAGETFRLKIIREGKEETQGVGYLEDGTMVVVENGKEAVGKTVDIIINSTIQTVSGRMIFAELK